MTFQRNSTTVFFRKTIRKSRALMRSRLRIAGVAILLLVFLIVLTGSFLWHFTPQGTYGVNEGPSIRHPFGTDYLGHDLFSQIAWGAYPSLFVAIGAAIGSVVIGLAAGVVGGYFSRLEILLNGASDVVMAFPAIPLLIIVGSLFTATNTLIMVMLILVMWPAVARAVRAQVGAIKKMAYIEASSTSGMTDLQVIAREIVPEVGAIAVAYFVLNVALAIVLTTAIEFLGVGNPSVVTWGSILYWAQQYAFFIGDWWWVIFPGLMITLTASAFALIAYSLEETLNPRLKHS